MTSTTKDKAITVLKHNSYLQDASDDLLEELAFQMVPITVNRGDVLVDEGDIMHYILFIENGTLIRTKLSVSAQDIPTTRSSLSIIKDNNEQHLERVDKSIIVSKLQGIGRSIGMLHACEHTNNETNVAYTTVSAETTSKIWMLSSDDFRYTISSNPNFCLFMLNAMARELRVGSKSLRSLIKTTSNKGNDDNDDDDDDDDNNKKKNSIIKSIKTIKVLSYDSPTWVSDIFQPAIEQYNKKQQEQVEEENNGNGNECVRIIMDYTTERLSEQSATYAAGYDAITIFVNDTVSERTIHTLSMLGIKMIAMRSSSDSDNNSIDYKAAIAHGMTITRVPPYSAYAVAEMAVALLLTVNRNIAKANARIKMANFTLNTGLMGIDIHDKTIGIMGVGRIGTILFHIMKGFNVNKILCYDINQKDDIKNAGGIYVSNINEIYIKSDILFIMLPLQTDTYHIINKNSIQHMKSGIIIINVSRGGLIDTNAILYGIHNNIISGIGMDVYENEKEYFFQDFSGARQISDTNLLSLLAEPNVIMTAHQAFFTKETVTKIANTVIQNIVDYKMGITGRDHPNNCIADWTCYSQHSLLSGGNNSNSSTRDGGGGGSSSSKQVVGSGSIVSSISSGIGDSERQLCSIREIKQNTSNDDDNNNNNNKKSDDNNNNTNEEEHTTTTSSKQQEQEQPQSEISLL